jgi:hypothetical protein
MTSVCRVIRHLHIHKNESILYKNGKRVNGQQNDNWVSFAAGS